MSLLTFLFGTGPRPTTPRPESRAPVVSRTRTVSGRPVVAIPRNSQRLHEERGWTRRGDELHGYFRTRYGSFSGRIARPGSSSPEYFITDPPKSVLSGPHGACFRQRGPREFLIHWSVRPTDLDSGILRVEHTLQEAFS